jgi:flagellar protein FlaG
MAMAAIDQGSQPIEPVPGIGSLGGKGNVPSPPGKTSQMAAGSGPSSAATREATLPDLRKVLDGLSPHQNVGLTYVIDRETHSVIIKVIDRDTNEVLRQVPPEELMKLRAAMRDLFGLLFKAEV